MLLSETGFLFGKSVTGYFKLNDIPYYVKWLKCVILDFTFDDKAGISQTL